jgi:uracil-DNA glycosylase
VADREALLDAIADEIRAHGTCGFDVCDQATNMVPGEGSATAAVVVVGEAPGASEDAQGRPFVGRAGKLLDELLAEAGLAREEVFITNVLKARPPRNRDPRADEVAHHLPWLQAQLEVIGPRLIVPVGRHALKWFAPRAAIGEVHGHVLQVDDRTLFPMYHPAAAIYDRRLLPTLIADAHTLREVLAAS